MGTVEIGALIAVIGCFVGLAGWLSGRDKRVSSDAQWRGSVDAKLDIVIGLQGNVAEHDRILGNHGERLAKVESSAAQAHHRIDEIVNDKK